MSRRPVELVLGTLALVALGTNVAWHVGHGRWFDCFWVCDLATLLAGLGLILRSPLLCTAAFAWAVPGALAWGTEALVLGTAFSAPSYLLHLSGLGAAVYGVRVLGAHPGGFVTAIALFALLLLLSRALPAQANVNCAFGPRETWKLWATLGLPHHLTIAVVALAICWTMNRLARSWSTWARSPSPGRLS